MTNYTKHRYTWTALKKCIDPAVRPEEEITDVTDDLPDLCDGEVNEDEFQPLGATPTDFQGNDENDDNSDYYMVKKFIYQRDSNQGKQYFVKWKDFPTSSNSWVNESDLNDAFNNAL